MHYLFCELIHTSDLHVGCYACANLMALLCLDTRADLARYLGISRARVTQVLDRLVDHQLNRVETANLTPN